MSMSKPTAKPTTGPRYVVGIDFGYTHTGVAFACLESGEIFEPSVVNRWPGKLGEVINKVPTKISYRSGSEKYTGWGFSLQRKSNRTTVEQYFKLNLDEEILKAAHLPDDEDGDGGDDYDPSNYEDVKKWFEDYLHAVYEWVKQTLEGKGVVWNKTSIEFIFSVPTTWSSNVVAEYEKIVKKAGYGQVIEHSACTGLTEAEAAAVYTAVYDAKGVVRGNSKQGNQGNQPKVRKYEQGDVLIVCDAGGGTTDVSALIVHSFHNHVPQMNELGPVQGDSIGSVKIDEAFAVLVKRRLRHVKSKAFDRKAALTEMTSNEFQHYKVHFGEKSIALLPSISIRVPGLTDSDNFPAACIMRGQMVFTIAEIEKLFDDQIEGITKLIDNQLKHLDEEYNGKNVKYLILSGGLGSSEYLRQKLDARYIKQKVCVNAKAMTIMVAKDPQLVVCRGLVLGRIQDSFKISVISGRCCRASYGITYDELFNKDKHHKRQRVKNRNDRQYYVPGKICWLINKGAFVNDSDPPKKNFNQSLSYKGDSKWLNHRIVRFDGSRALPETVDAPGITQVCKVACNLGPAIEAQGRELEHVRVQHRHRIFGQNLGGKFYEVDYDIVVRIGPADLKFELWFDGQDRAQNKEIRVDWKREYKVVAVEGAGESDSEGSEIEFSGEELSAVDSGYSFNSRSTRY